MTEPRVPWQFPAGEEVARRHRTFPLRLKLQDSQNALASRDQQGVLRHRYSARLIRRGCVSAFELARRPEQYHALAVQKRVGMRPWMEATHLVVNVSSGPSPVHYAVFLRQ